MERAKKEQLVADLSGTFSEATVVVVTHQNGLTVAESTDLRRRMLAAGASFKVTKNRLADLFEGPTAIAFSTDPVAAAKVAVDFAKTNEKLTVIGGAMGEIRLDANGIKALATLPSLDELRAKLVGMISTPATRIAGVLQAPAGQVARVIAAHARQGNEAA